jgi:hypothetical protein
MTSPEIWGPHAWEFLHAVTFAYPEHPNKEDKIRYYNFFYWLRYVLPCKKCRINMEKHLTKHPLTDNALSSKKSLVKWLIDFHNIVNYNLGKPIYTYSQALRGFKDPKSNNSLSIFYYILIGIVVLIIVSLFYYLIKKKK